MSKRLFLVAVSLIFCASTSTLAQVLNASELSSRDLQQLDRDRTVVIIPGGIFEQHGPYLPSFTDGYLNEWIARRTAEAIVAQRDVIMNDDMRGNTAAFTNAYMIANSAANSNMRSLAYASICTNTTLCANA